MKRLFLVFCVAVALILTVTSCPAPSSPGATQTPQPPTGSETPTPTPTSTIPIDPGQKVEVTARAFFDYNGNGTRQGGEPAISGINLTYQPSNIGSTTDKNGLVTVKLYPGSYTVSVNDPSGKYKYILDSTTEFASIGDGLKVDISGEEELPIPLAQGFYSWPFTPRTGYGAIYYFQPDDPTIDPLSLCEGGT